MFTTQGSQGRLEVLNGVRFLSMGWALIGGAYLWGPIWNEIMTTGKLELNNTYYKHIKPFPQVTFLIQQISVLKLIFLAAASLGPV